MLAAKLKSHRFLELIQLILAAVSTCTVLEASRVSVAPQEVLGFYASEQPREAARDRSLADLARFERKRREAEQRKLRHGGELGHSLQQRQLRA